MKSKIFKNMKHANIECPGCNWKRKQRKKQEEDAAQSLCGGIIQSFIPELEFF